MTPYRHQQVQRSPDWSPEFSDWCGAQFNTWCSEPRLNERNLKLLLRHPFPFPQASPAVVAEAGYIVVSLETCVFKELNPSQTARTVAVSSLHSRPPSPPILGVPFACRAGSPVEASDILDDSTASPVRLREGVHGGIKSEPKSPSPLPGSEAASPVEWVGDSAVSWTEEVQGDIKAEPKSPCRLPESSAVSPFECVDSVELVSTPLLSALPSSSLQSADDTDLTSLVEPSPASRHRVPSAMPEQKMFAARTSIRGNPHCAGDGCADSDELMNVDSTPKVSESDSESGLGSDEDVPSSMASKLYSRLITKRRLNNNASLRYRQRKKQELNKIEKELAKLAATNANLKLQVQLIRDEISFVKGQLRGIAKAREPMKVHITT